MTATLAHIRRHPIKSVGGEELASIALSPGRRLPGDREWAVLTESGERHATGPQRWLPKSCFLRGAASLPLQAVTGGWCDDRIVLNHPDRAELSLDPQHDGDLLLNWLRPLWPADAPAPTRLLHGAAIWTDQKWPWLSILSLGSLRDLEQRSGQQLGIHRWRGNLWIDGWEAFAERDLVGHTFQIGPVELRVTEQISRCEAPGANTDSGQRDIDMLATLKQHYGDTSFGIFAEVVTAGTITIGDKVQS